MLRRTTSSELAEYMAYDRLEPIGEARADLRAGIVASALVNHSLNPPKTPTRPIDFMPFAKPQGPIRLDNPAEHGKLLAKTLFGDRGSVKPDKGSP